MLFRLWLESNSEIVFAQILGSEVIHLFRTFWVLVVCFCFPDHLSLIACLPEDQEKEYLDSVEKNSLTFLCWYNSVFLEGAHKFLLFCYRDSLGMLEHTLGLLSSLTVSKYFDFRVCWRQKCINGKGRNLAQSLRNKRKYDTFVSVVC